MPELPEVETIINDLRKKVINKKIACVDVRLIRTIKNSTASFKRNLVGNKFKDIKRVGKLIIFYLDKKDKYLLVHLKMTGQLVYKNGQETVAGGHSRNSPVDKLPNKYTRVVIEFRDGSRLFFNDMRTFGYMKIVDGAELKKIIASFGFEPLGSEFTMDEFFNILRRRTTTIKALLLNQSLIAGIGNIYADEILFKASIRPNRRANTLKKGELEKIFKAIGPILENAIKHRGTTFNNYVDVEGRSGGFLQLLKVYGRGGRRCARCRIGIIKKIKVAGRGTSYCPFCQK